MTQSRVTGGAPLAHHGLAHFHKIKRWNQLWNDVETFVSTSGNERFLITSEGFSSKLLGHEEFARELGQRMRIFDRVVAICWIRRQDDFIASLSVQSGKHGGRSARPSGLVSKFKDADYQRVLSKLTGEIPNLEIKAHLYTKDAPILQQFLGDVDLDQSLLLDYSPKRVNTTVSPQMYRLQILINRFCYDNDIDVTGLHAALLNTWDYLPPEAKQPPAIPLTVEDRRSILEHYLDSNRRLCETFGFNLDFFQVGHEGFAEAPSYNLVKRVERKFIQQVSDAVRLSPSKGGGDHARTLLAVLEKIECD